jgi:hypothetical protein
VCDTCPHACPQFFATGIHTRAHLVVPVDAVAPRWSPVCVCGAPGCVELGVAECTIDDLFSSEDGCATLDVTGRRGERNAALSLAVVALKTGWLCAALHIVLRAVMYALQRDDGRPAP